MPISIVKPRPAVWSVKNKINWLFQIEAIFKYLGLEFKLKKNK